MKIHSVKILQIMPAPGRLEDKDGNLYAGYALIEMEISYLKESPESEVVRDILPFHTEGSLIGLPDPDNAYYLAHGLGDARPAFAEFISDGSERSYT